MRLQAVRTLKISILHEKHWSIAGTLDVVSVSNFLLESRNFRH
jgi:hypothetical protein